MKDKLFRFAFRLLQHAQEAEDAIQDVMVGIWMKRDEWGQWKNLEAYCMTATRNNCLDRLRKRRSTGGQHFSAGPGGHSGQRGSRGPGGHSGQRFMAEPEERARQIGSSEPDPYERMMNKEIVQRIRQCMAALPENQQMVIQLREIEGFSYNEIAEVLDMSMDQVKINLFRARNAIKKSMIKQEAS